MIEESDLTKKDKSYEQLLEKLKYEEERLTALLKMTQLRGLSEKEYINYTLEECVRLTKSKVGYLHFVNEDQETLSLFTWSEDVLKDCTAEKVPHYPISEAGIWADCFRERKAVIHNDYPNYPHKKGYPEGHFPVYRHMSVPVFDGENIVSIVGVGNKKDAYDDSDTRQLTLFMDKMWRIIKQNKADELLKKSEMKYKEAYNRAEFYRRLFAHDMRNILQSILSLSELIKYKIKTETNEFVSFIENIQKQVAKGADLINNVRKMSDLEITNTSEDIEVISLLNSAIETAPKNFLDRTVTIKFKNELNEFHIKANKFLLDIFDNIIINAIHHNESEEIQISIKISEIKDKGKNLIKIEFIDNGIGIPNDLKTAILNRNYKKHEKSTGLGLGLMLIQNLLSSFNGNLLIEDKVKGDYTKGVNFIIILPEFDS